MEQNNIWRLKKKKKKKKKKWFSKQKQAQRCLIFYGYCPKEQNSSIYNRDLLEKRKSKCLRLHVKLNKNFYSFNFHNLNGKRLLNLSYLDILCHTKRFIVPLCFHSAFMLYHWIHDLTNAFAWIFIYFNKIFFLIISLTDKLLIFQVILCQHTSIFSLFENILYNTIFRSSWQ